MGVGDVGNVVAEALQMSEIIASCCIDLSNGKRIWIPPTGRPFWVLTSRPNAGPDLTDEEIEKFIIKGRSE
jgi:hypothetical protein